jgi:hypothetical protein
MTDSWRLVLILLGMLALVGAIDWVARKVEDLWRK